MFRTSEGENEYRSGNSGPKYLMRGPHSNFAVMLLQPGQDFKAHYHDVMEENFFTWRARWISLWMAKRIR